MYSRLFFSRITDDHKLSTTMSLNIPSPRQYEHLTSTVKPRHSSSTITTPRDGLIDSGRYQSNGKNDELIFD
jgi:hypothetical protein